MDILKDKVLLITGGTGSFGTAVLKKFLQDSGLSEIRIFSRDEKKQDEMRNTINNEKVKYYVGDVRDKSSLVYPMKDADFVFHAAALKQVPSCEFYPMEAVKTNVIGTENVLSQAIESGVSKVICLSTDKAVYPINAMGISKAMMEKMAVAKSRLSTETVITCTRYGNVMGSRGSVIPLFISQIKSGLPITITDPAMTRFMMRMEDAIDLVFFAFINGQPGDLFVQKAPATAIADLAEALLEIFESKNGMREIGTRHGEKLYEGLLTREEFSKAEDMDNYYKVKPDARDLNYSKYFSSGAVVADDARDYHSHNATRLTKQDMKELLLSLDFIKEELGIQKLANDL